MEAGEGWVECRQDGAMRVFVKDGRGFTSNEILKTTIKAANLRGRANHKISTHWSLYVSTSLFTQGTNEPITGQQLM